MKAVSFEDLDITEDFEFDETKVDLKIQELTKSKPHLFKKDLKLPPDVTPGQTTTEGKSFKDMNLKELQEAYKKVLTKG